MFKSKKIISTMLLGATVLNAGVATVMADEGEPVKPSGEAITTVSYDNRNIIDPGNNGQWRAIVPTAISFNDEKKTVDTGVEIVGINGYELEDFAKLSVKTEVKSENAYDLKGPGANAKYTLTLGGKEFDKNADFNEFAKELTNVESTATGQAKYVGAATQKGKYTDTLTFKFTETAKELK